MSSLSSDAAKAESTDDNSQRTLSNSISIPNNNNNNNNNNHDKSHNSNNNNSKPIGRKTSKTVKTTNSKNETDQEQIIENDNREAPKEATKEKEKEQEQDKEEKPDVIQLDIDNAKNLVFAGQTLTGKILLELAEDIELQQLHVKVHGVTKTHWAQRKLRTTRLHGGERRHYETQPALNFVTKQLAETTLVAGKHVVTFSAHIDEDVPSSYEDANGSMCYYCRVHIHERQPQPQPGKQQQRIQPVQRRRPLHKAKCLFYVVACSRLENMTGLQTPITLKDTQPVKPLASSSCCQLGDLSCQLVLDKRGFVCGECVPLTVTIANESRLKMSRVSVCLQQTVTYREDEAVTGTNQVHQEINTLQLVHSKQACPAHSTTELNSRSGELLLTVMPLCPSYVQPDNYIAITYSITLKVQSLLELSIPIVIGTVPFVESACGLQRMLKPPNHALTAAAAATDAEPADYVGPLYPFYATAAKHQSKPTTPNVEAEAKLKAAARKRNK